MAASIYETVSGIIASFERGDIPMYFLGSANRTRGH